MTQEGEALERILDHVLGEKPRGVGPQLPPPRALEAHGSAGGAEDNRDRRRIHARSPAVLASTAQAERQSVAMAVVAHLVRGMKPLEDLVYPPRCP